uniref:Uncharacterized protein n=1 Tax=Meloidogyne javanica TaxID=6303 RepID=A0A915LXL5_MELJA
MERKKQTYKLSNQEVEQFLLNEEHFTTITTTEKPLEEAETEEEIDRELREKEEENPQESEEEEAPLKEEQDLIKIPTLSMLKIKKRIKNEEEELKEIRRHPRLDNSINNKNNRVDNYLIKQQNRVGKINKLKEENEVQLTTPPSPPAMTPIAKPPPLHSPQKPPKNVPNFVQTQPPPSLTILDADAVAMLFPLMKMKNYVNLPIQMLSFHQC